MRASLLNPWNFAPRDKIRARQESRPTVECEKPEESGKIGPTALAKPPHIG
jgi:hypothetical protein